MNWKCCVVGRWICFMNLSFIFFDGKLFCYIYMLGLFFCDFLRNCIEKVGDLRNVEVC